MMFKVDENLPTEVADLLMNAGHDACTVHQQGLAGMPDEALMARLKLEARIMITLDRGIGDIRRFPPDTHAGVVVLRPVGRSKPADLLLLKRHLSTLVGMELRRRLVVVAADGMRVR
jgi:predicted nuclease of predicted toxin-antitoxin system